MNDATSFRSLAAPAAIIAALVYGAHALLVAPPRDRAQSLSTELGDGPVRADTTLEARSRMNLLAQELRQRRDLLTPLAAPLANAGILYADAQRRAKQHGVTLARFQPSAPRETGDGAVAQELLLELEGELVAVRDMLRETEAAHPVASLIEAFVRPAAADRAGVVAVVRLRLHQFVAPAATHTTMTSASGGPDERVQP